MFPARRLAAVATALLLGAPTAVLVASAAPAQAKPVICDSGAKQIVITSMSRPVFLTHVKGFHAAPGDELTISKTIASTNEMTASAEVYGEVSGEAGAVFGKVSAKAGFKVAAQGKKTDSSSETVSHKLGASKRDRYYAAYVGTTRVTGDYKTRTCKGEDVGWGSWRYGEYRSFRPTTIEGIGLCKRDRYQPGTAPFVACRATWGN